MATEPTIRFPAGCATAAQRVAFLYRVQERLRLEHNRRSAAAKTPKARAVFEGWYRARFQPLHWALARRIPPIRALIATTDDPDYGERKLAWKADDRWEGTEEHRGLINALAVEAPPREPPDPTEDLTAFTEVDDDGDITVTANNCDVSTMKFSADTYVYKSYGAGHFGDYEHDVKTELTYQSPSGDKYWGFWAVTNDYGAYMQMGNGQVAHWYNAGSLIIYLRDKGESKSDYWNGCGEDTAYYCKAERSGTTVTLKIYTGSIGGTLQDTLTMSDCASTAWEYLMCCQGRNWTGAGTMSGYSQNYDIHEGAGLEHTVTETLGLGDSVLKGVGMTLVETMGLADSSPKGVGKGLSETLGLADSSVKGAGKTLAETVGLLDVLTKGAATSVLEQLGLDDTILKAAATTLTETLGLSDETSGTLVLLQTIVETLGLSDSVSMATMKMIGEALALTDVIRKAASVTLEEQLALSDPLTKAAAVVLVESLSLSDSLSVATTKIIAETLAITDTVLKRASLTVEEQLALADTLTKAAALALVETLGLSDSVATSLIQEIRGRLRALDRTVTRRVSSQQAYQVRNQGGYRARPQS